MSFIIDEFEFLQDLFELKMERNSFLSKFELMRKFKFKFLSDLNVTTTNIYEKNLVWKNLNIYFHYQRQNLFILENNNFYNPFGLKRDSAESFYFTKNGQSANMIATSIIKDFLDLEIVKAHDFIYFETQPLLEFRNKGEDKCLLIDTSVVLKDTKLKDFITDDYKLIYLDASVLDNNDNELVSLINYIRNKNIPFIMTKSHLKLDFCGGEYSQLGSISILNLEDELNNLRLNTRNWKSDIPFYGKLLYEMISLYGVMADLEAIFPHLNDKEYSKHILNRNLLIKKNSQNLARSLSEVIRDDWEVREYEHGQFFLLIMERNENFPKLKLKNYIKHQQNMNSDYPIYFCDSFGFDFVSISIIGLSENRFAFRICPGVVDSDKSLTELKIIIDTIEKLYDSSTQ